MGPRTKYRYGAGLDVHKYQVTACVAVQRQARVEKHKIQQFKTTRPGLEALCRFLAGFLLHVIVMEATGVYTNPVADKLATFAGWGGIKPRVIVINPSLARKYPGEAHEDRVDALELARLGLLGLAAGSYIPTGALEVLRRMTRDLHYLSRDCTRYKARVKRVLSQAGLPLRDFNLETGWAMDLCQALVEAGGDFGAALEFLTATGNNVSRSTRRAIANRVQDLQKYEGVHVARGILVVFQGFFLDLAFQEALTGVIAAEVESLVTADTFLARLVAQLARIPGVGDLTALVIVVEVGNIDRFPSCRHFLSYAGGASTLYQSGERKLRGHLSKRVNHFLKRAFFQIGKSICTTVKDDSDLKEYARGQLNKHWNDKKLAYMNVGIKVARVVYALLKHGREYDPFYDSSKDRTRPQTLGEVVEFDLAPAFVLREIRKRTRRFVKFVNRTLGAGQETVYALLGDYFTQLGMLCPPGDQSTGRS